MEMVHECASAVSCTVESRPSLGQDYKPWRCTIALVMCVHVWEGSETHTSVCLGHINDLLKIKTCRPDIR